jgi:hypothetical protein
MHAHLNMGKINEFKLPNAENKKDELDNEKYKITMYML